MDNTSESETWIGHFMPGYSYLVRSISFICIGLGLFFSLPFIILIILDFVIWVWRTIWSRNATKEPDFNEARANAKPTDTTAASTTGIDETLAHQRTTER